MYLTFSFILIDHEFGSILKMRSASLQGLSNSFDPATTLCSSGVDGAARLFAFMLQMWIIGWQRIGSKIGRFFAVQGLSAGADGAGGTSRVQ